MISNFTLTIQKWNVWHSLIFLVRPERACVQIHQVGYCSEVETSPVNFQVMQHSESLLPDPDICKFELWLVFRFGYFQPEFIEILSRIRAEKKVCKIRLKFKKWKETPGPEKGMKCVFKKDLKEERNRCL